MGTLRRFVPLAPLPGAVVAAAGYGLGSTLAILVGWWLVVIGLLLIASNQITRWTAFIAAAAFAGSAQVALFALGFVTTAALMLIVMTINVLTYGTRGRIVGAAALTVVGVGALLSFGYPDSAYLDNPATQIWASLVLAPAAVLFGALWMRLDVPGTHTAEPATFLRRFLAGLVGWVSMGIVVSALGIGVLAPVAYPICVLLLQVLPTALWGRTFGQLCAGVRVVRVDTGGSPGWLRSFVRFAVFQAVPLLGLIYFVGWANRARLGAGGGLPERLAWDHASGTAVVRVARTQTAGAPAQT